MSEKLEPENIKLLVNRDLCQGADEFIEIDNPKKIKLNDLGVEIDQCRFNQFRHHDNDFTRSCKNLLELNKRRITIQ